MHTLIPRESLRVGLALVCGITVCVTIPQHQGLNVQKQGKIQYRLWPIFSAEGGLLCVALWQTASQVLLWIQYVLEAKRGGNQAPLWKWMSPLRTIDSIIKEIIVGLFQSPQLNSQLQSVAREEYQVYRGITLVFQANYYESHRVEHWEYV